MHSRQKGTLSPALASEKRAMLLRALARRISVCIVSGLIGLVATSSPVGAAVDPIAGCPKWAVKPVARHLRDVLTCYVKSAQAGAPVKSSCTIQPLSQAIDKLARLQASGKCPETLSSQTLLSRNAEFAKQIAAMLHPDSATSACAAARLNAVASMLKKRLTIAASIGLWSPEKAASKMRSAMAQFERKFARGNLVGECDAAIGVSEALREMETFVALAEADLKNGLPSLSFIDEEVQSRVLPAGTTLSGAMHVSQSQIFTGLLALQVPNGPALQISAPGIGATVFVVLDGGSTVTVDQNGEFFHDGSSLAFAAVAGELFAAIDSGAGLGSLSQPARAMAAIFTIFSTNRFALAYRTLRETNPRQRDEGAALGARDECSPGFLCEFAVAAAVAVGGTALCTVVAGGCAAGSAVSFGALTIPCSGATIAVCAAFTGGTAQVTDLNDVLVNEVCCGSDQYWPPPPPAEVCAATLGACEAYCSTQPCGSASSCRQSTEGEFCCFPDFIYPSGTVSDQQECYVNADCNYTHACLPGLCAFGSACCGMLCYDYSDPPPVPTPTPDSDIIIGNALQGTAGYMDGTGLVFPFGPSRTIMAFGYDFWTLLCGGIRPDYKCTEPRGLAEFEIGDVPSGPYAQVVLELEDTATCSGCDIPNMITDVSGYVADGQLTFEDWGREAQLLFQVSRPKVGITPTEHDVTAFVNERLQLGDRWIGFRFVAAHTNSLDEFGNQPKLRLTRD